MPASPNRLVVRRLARTVLAVCTGLALIVSLHGLAADAAPRNVADDPNWEPAKVKSVSGPDARPVPAPADAGAGSDLRTVPTVTWPSKGVAEAEVARPATGSPSGWLAPGGREQSPSAPFADVDRGRAGTLPVWLGSPATANAADTPGRVRVESLGRHGDALWLTVGRSDGVAKAGRVELRVGYERFRDAYGGDWSNRLRVVRRSDGVVFPTRNDGRGVLSADVPVPADGAAPTLYAVQAGPDGGTGKFTATSLSPTANWTVGGSSGDFTWSYPMDTPPGIGGPAAKVALDYSSGGVDGRTSTTNNQPSWAGEGFELNPGGSIERRYASCATDKGGNNGTRVTGDLCWKTDNAHFTLNGTGGELIQDDTNKQWRMKGDDGSKVEHLFGAVNGDDNGEYWKITTKDGSQYFFGLNRLPGWDTAPADKRIPTNSAFTVPVFGNHGGEPCNKPAFADSWCQQAYRLNLDYVVDRHGNTMSLFYDTEQNYYGRNSTATTVSAYTRAGSIARIEYGQRAGQVYTAPAVAQVLFTRAERCIPGSACTTSVPETYPDTPTDQICSSSTNCPNKFNPTFFTSKRLAKVATRVWRGTAYGEVDSWTLRHSFRDPGDGTRKGLWLEAINHAGHVGTGIQAPEVNFDGVSLANRVDAAGDGLPPMKWWRVNRVSYGTGGDITVNYAGPDCTPTDVPRPDTNGRRCHPMKWTPEGSTERTDWFHKYVVTSVLETDRVAQADEQKVEPVVTMIEYLSPPTWHFDDADGLVEINQKTWGQWRGYDRVRVKKGSAETDQLITESRYFRGMDGDRLEGGGTKDVKVTDSTGTQVDDHAALPGQIREQSTFNGTALVERTITDQWISAPTASRVHEWGTSQAHQVEQGANVQVEALEGTGLRQSAANNIYAADGTLLAANDLNDLADPNDDVCTRHEYTGNATVGIAELPKRQQTVSVACDKPFGNAQVIAEQRTYYDNATSVDTPPTRGLVTRTERLAGFNADGTARYQSVTTAAYDAIGRGISTTDALGHTTTTSFGPAGAAPVTQTTVTQANGHRTVTELEPAWGTELAVTDPAGRRTEATYDAMGRTTKVWLPGRTGAANPAMAGRPGQNVAGLAAAADNAAIPNMEYSYRLSATEPNSVTTRTLQTDGSVQATYELSDGLLRKRQNQEPAKGGGRIITGTVYDSRGLAVAEHGPYHNDGAPVGHAVHRPTESELPTQKVTEYDAAGRPTVEAFRSFDQEQWRTTHRHAGDRQSTDPPAGDEPTTRITDVQGRVSELRQYSGESDTGAHDKTTYSYDPAGRLLSVTDQAGIRWAYEYDLRGRKVKEIDPDKGTTTYTYNDLDQVVTSTDARGVTVANVYDTIGRKKSVHSGSVTGPTLSEWSYDSLAAGSPTSATRWVNGKAYTTRVTGYGPQGKPLGAEIVIPDSEGALSRTYTNTATYNADGEIATSSMPAVGGLPAETLRYGYDSHDQPTTIASDLTTYVRDTTYTPYGEVAGIRMGATGGTWVDLKYEYQEGTRRLSRVVTDRETSPRRISDVAYTYDPGGNITQITDAPSSTSGEATDTQCFDYDYLRRLTSAWTPGSGDCAAAPTQPGHGGPAPYWHAWTYDVTGNRKTETRKSPQGSTTASYAYPAAGQPRPHAVTGAVTTGTGMPAGGRTDSYGYDATGNQTQRTLAGAGETFGWDAEGHLSKVTGPGGASTEYTYDADGNRLLRRDASGTTLYLGDTEVLLKPTGQLEGTRYYKHGEQTVAVRTAGSLVWLGADHHGTSTTAVDNATQTVQRRRSDPYGNLRGAAPAAWPGQRGFVGGSTDPSTGLVHLGAREYDPTLGRFISVDPEMDVQDPQTLNGYAYANNNPITFSDPDGRFFGAIISAVKHVAQTVTKRVVQTVKSVVHTVTPVINWVRDKISQHVEAIKSFVKKAVEVVKKVVKTVKQVVKKAIKVVKKVAKKIAKVAKKVASAVKNTVKKVAKTVGTAVTKAARAVAKATTDAAQWAWRNREQILSTALDIGLTIAACAGTVGAGCVARGLLFVAATTIATNTPAGAAAAAAVMFPGLPEPVDPHGPDIRSHAGPPGGDPDDVFRAEASNTFKYKDHDQGITARSDLPRSRSKWATIGMGAAKLFHQIFG